MVVGADLRLLSQRLPNPVHETPPVRHTDQDDGEPRHLLGLDQRQGLEQFIQGAETAGEYDETVAVLDETGLAGEEVAEVHTDLDPLIDSLLERQLDAQADARAAGFEGALVRCLHDAWPAAGDHRVAGLHQPCPHPLCHRILGVSARGSGAAEDTDRGTHIGHGTEPLDELRLDAQHTPRVGVYPVACPAGIQQSLIGGGALRLPPAQDHRAFVAFW